MKKNFLLAVVLMILISPTVTKAAADWVWVYSDEYQTTWIDNNSIGRDGNMFFAYFKETYSDAGRNKEIEKHRSDGLSVSGYNNLSHQISFWYFKNSGGIKYYSLMEAIAYDANGNVLRSFSTNDVDWYRVIPDTYGETKYDAAWERVRGK